MEVKVVISYSNGKSEQKELRDEKANSLLGKKIGDIIEGGLLDVKGDLLITGGSDRDGFAMRKDVDGPIRKKILLSTGVGFNPTTDGERRKKRVRGNMITDDIIQINTKLLEGPKPKKEVKKEEKPKPKKEVKKEEKPKPKKEKPKPKKEKPKPKKEKPKPKKEKPKPKKEKPKPKKEVKKIPLTEVRGIGKKRAEQLENAGITDVNKLLAMNKKEIAEKADISEKVVEKFKKAAEKLEET
jgi:small subunit ribosomal protein S6e